MSKEGEVSEWIEKSEQPDIVVFAFAIIVLLVIITVLAWLLSILDIVYGVGNAIELAKKLVNWLIQSTNEILSAILEER